MREDSCQRSRPAGTAPDEAARPSQQPHPDLSLGHPPRFVRNGLSVASHGGGRDRHRKQGQVPAIDPQDLCWGRFQVVSASALARQAQYPCCRAQAMAVWEAAILAIVKAANEGRGR